MINFFINAYRFLFARKILYKFNKFIYLCGLRGMGVLNYESGKVSGEDNFIQNYFKGKKEPIVFDVGANVGNYSKKIYSINSQAIIYAFEPHPKTFESLKSGIENNNFHPNNLAVGNENSKISLYDYEDEDGSSHASVFKGVMENIHHKKYVEHTVNVISLDEFVINNSITVIDLLKIDTEGNELNVIKGIVSFINEGKVKAIHFEFNEMNLISRTVFMDFWNILPQYNFYRMLPDGLVRVREYSPAYCEVFSYQNIVALLKSEDDC